MRKIIMNDVSRCRGELLGDDFGHADKICEIREHCKRFIQSVLDAGNKDGVFSYTGWACATEDKENFIPMERQEESL